MRPHARWTLLVLALFLSTLVPIADVSAKSLSRITSAEPTSPLDVIESQPVPPPAPYSQEPPTTPIAPLSVADGHASALLVLIAVNPDPITVGETAVISLTINNISPDAADDAQLHLPLPAGSNLVPLANPALQSENAGWLWSLGHIDGQGTKVVTASIQVGALPPGEALVLRPSIIARDMPQPVQTVGGAIVIPTPSTLEAVTTTAAFQPGRPMTFRSKDSTVAVTMQDRTATKQLRVHYAHLLDKDRPSKL